LNINKPENIVCDRWPKIYIFGVFDGHGGSNCADFLRDNLHNYVIKETCFANDPRTAIIKGFENAEKEFINNHTVNNNGEVIDRSGSCALMVFIVGMIVFNLDDICYIANVGDSRAILSRNGKIDAITNDHKPNNESEVQRIMKAGGSVYQYCFINI
jgi:protein phosphatase 2C family protein 2/3